MLLSTSSTGATAFGIKFLNETTNTLSFVTIHFTGELWRQSDLRKTLECYYLIDPTGAAAFSRNRTASLTPLNVSLPADSGAVGGVAVDGSLSINQTYLSVVDQPIIGWQPKAAFWLVWEMADASGKAQGLAIDDLSFSASEQPLGPPPPPPLTVASSGNKLIISWAALAGRTYLVEFKQDLEPGPWTALGPSLLGSGLPITLTNDFSIAKQRFYRLRLLP